MRDDIKKNAMMAAQTNQNTKANDISVEIVGLQQEQAEELQVLKEAEAQIVENKEKVALEEK